MKTLQPGELSNWNGRVVDVREPDEFARERLERACENVPLARIGADASAWDRAAPVLVMCKSGARSRQAAGQLEGMGFQQVAMLEGGLQACRSAGLAVTAAKGPIPIMRQVMIGASLFLLAGLILAMLHPAFIALTWFVAIMLGVAGVTGLCPMACMLSRMPWNRSVACPSGSCSTSTPR